MGDGGGRRTMPQVELGRGCYAKRAGGFPLVILIIQVQPTDSLIADSPKPLNGLQCDGVHSFHHLQRRRSLKEV